MQQIFTNQYSHQNVSFSHPLQNYSGPWRTEQKLVKKYSGSKNQVQLPTGLFQSKQKMALNTPQVRLIGFYCIVPICTYIVHEDCPIVLEQVFIRLMRVIRM